MNPTSTLPTPPKKILIVEDDYSLAELYRIKTELLGYTPLTAYDGAHALELIEQEQPDLVLLDLMIPKISGDKVLKAMRITDWGKATKVLIISNVDESDAPRGLRSLGIEGYALKANLSHDDLENIIASILDTDKK
jgi:DNA-binding response OmpR family regulator